MAFKKYNLTESQIKQIARLCVQEQGGSEAGTKAEASLMANLLETSASRQKKYGSDGNGLYNFVRNGGWFYKAAHFMDNGSASATQIAWVRDVLVNGNRTLPKYIDEHDCFSDIASISTGSIRNRSDYVKNKTIIKNKMGSTYTFYCFPTSTSDPFGYTSAAYNKVMSEGGSSEPTSNEKTLNETTKYTGYVISDSLNVRTWAGVENDLCSFSPLYFQTAVAVCDEVKASDGSQWLYIKSNGKYGFVSAKYISKTRPDYIQEDTAASNTPQEKVINIAENEIGYLEKKSNSNLDSKTGNAGSNNYTKYARDVAPDVQGMAWCATFCMWLFTKAFGKDLARKMCGGLSPDCDEVAENYKSIGQFYKTPKVGDQILFIKNGNDYYHTGIVYKVTSATVYTIEGNTSSGSEVIPNGGAVCKKSYAIGNSKIGGYGRPKYDLVSSNPTPAPTPKPEPAQTEPKLNENVKWTGYINVDSSPVRSWAGKENSKVSFSPLKKGTAVGVCDEMKSKAGNKWYYIMYNGKHGFVYAKYISKDKPSAGWTGYVRTASLNVRTKAGKTNPQTTFSPLKKGAEVTVVGETKSSAGNKWYYISYNGKNGYCLASCITNKKPASKTAKTASDITVAEFLASCKNVMDTARTKNYRYGDSHATDPTTDKIISCDRLIAKALYDLGFKDQRVGGETCGTLDAWLKAHGFKRSTKASDIKKGSIVLVKHQGQSYIGHAFVAVSYNASTWSSKRYDAGSNDRIKSVQPITVSQWAYRKDDLVVYNIA